MKVAFSLAFARDALAPVHNFAVCQQHYPENFWNPAYQRHANGVTHVGGVVMVAGTAAGYGNTVWLDHGRGFETRYAHLDSIRVAKGQRVERGQPIGLSGNTGRSTAPHLHYEVLVDGRPVDPRRLIRN